jgi:cytochrome c oxidase subunit 3
MTDITHATPRIPPTHYYVPAQSPWPIVGSMGLFCFAVGLVNILHHHAVGKYLFLLGIMILITMMFGWFRNVIEESMGNLYSVQMDHSFRWGMGWFIVSEIFFFFAFFGALFYIRNITVPWLGGVGQHASTHDLLWPTFNAVWPVLQNPSPLIAGPKAVIHPWGLPLVNTVLLLSSSVTITYAHHALRAQHRKHLLLGLFLTLALGVSFLGFQLTEYYEAYHELGLTLGSGIYGSTFFMLTGFHGAHVTIGSIMLTVMLIRSYKNHFTPEHHFAFEAAAWYWHFVDVVWLGLFIFVYIL